MGYAKQNLFLDMMQSFKPLGIFPPALDTAETVFP
jgi:hypothetical protein